MLFGMRLNILFPKLEAFSHSLEGRQNILGWILYAIITK